MLICKAYYCLPNLDQGKNESSLLKSAVEDSYKKGRTLKANDARKGNNIELLQT